MRWLQLLAITSVLIVAIDSVTPRTDRNRHIGKRQPTKIWHSIRNKRQSSENAKWTNQTIHYSFASDYEGNATWVKEVLDVMAQRTCIKFVESGSATNKLQILNRDGDNCESSDVGMIKTPGSQNIKLGEYCETFAIITHEFLHTLGFEHSENRFDRDTALDWNIVEGDEDCNSIAIYGDEKGNAEIWPYDLGSAMHGSIPYCNNNEANWFPKREEFEYTVGTDIVSFYDYESVNKMYGCYDRCSEEEYNSCQNGGKPNPNNCSVCNCPIGYTGIYCDTVPEGGKFLKSTKEWQNATIKMTSDSPGYLFSDYFFKTVWISSPDDAEIEVQLLSMPNVKFDVGCNNNGVEFKVDEDVANTSPRYCKDETGKVLRSHNNPTVVNAHNFHRRNKHNVHFAYRHVERSE